MSKILFTYQNCCSYNSSRKKVMEVNIVDTLVESLMEELNCETVFKIPIFGGIPVYESVVVTWIIMLAVLVLCVLVGIWLHKEPSPILMTTLTFIGQVFIRLIQME